MTCRVEQDAPPIRRRLVSRKRGSEPKGLRLRYVEIVDRNIQVDLLGYRPVGPRRRTVLGDTHGGQPASRCLDRHELIVGESYLAADEVSPETGEQRRVITIENYRRQAGYGHATQTSP